MLLAFADRFPNHRLAPWTRRLAARITAPQSQHLRALVIASSPDNDTLATAGANDATMLRKLLVEKLGFTDTDVITLAGPAATRAGILNALEELARQSSATDHILVYYSGHSVDSDRFADRFLIASDWKSEPVEPSGGVILATELHNAMQKIHAATKWLVLETNGHTQFTELVYAGANYTLWSAAAPQQHAIIINESGAFSRAIVDSIDPTATLSSPVIHARVALAIERRGLRQKAVLAGSPSPSIFGITPITWLDTIARRSNYTNYNRDGLVSTLRSAMSLEAPFPALFRDVGIALLEHSAWNDAAMALQHARDAGNTDPVTAIALAVAHAAEGNIASAAQAVESRSTAMDPPDPQLDEAREAIHALRNTPNRAVLVGIDQYASLPPLQGATNDARAMQLVLLEHCGFSAEDIKLLVDRDATRAAILDALRALRDAPAGAATLFYFAGYGSYVSSNGDHTIVPTDGRESAASDLTLHDLRKVLGDDGAGPIVVLDAGWTRQHNSTTPSARAAAPDTRSRELMRDLADHHNPLPKHVGQCAIFNTSIRNDANSPPSDLETTGPSPLVEDTQICHGVMTRAIVSAFRLGSAEKIRVRHLLPEDAVCIPHDRAEAPVFARRPEPLLALLQSIRLLPVQNAIPSLRGWCARPGGVEHGAYFHLGLAYFVVKDHEAAIQAFRKERELGSSTPPGELAYYIGRAYLERREFAAAVSELEAATRLDPGLVPAYYYWGEALRHLVETQILVQAAGAFERYIEGGAPHGRLGEVAAQLAAWRDQTPLDAGAAERTSNGRPPR